MERRHAVRARMLSCSNHAIPTLTWIDIRLRTLKNSVARGKKSVLTPAVVLLLKYLNASDNDIS